MNPLRQRWATGLPRLKQWESSSALLADPYRFLSRQATRLGTPAFQARLMLEPTLCLVGAEAAELFYDPERFTRVGAAPEPVRATLFGKGGVQALDGTAHRQRKAVFLEATGGDAASRLVDAVRAEWLRALPDWAAIGRVSLYRAVQPVLTRAVCAWAGVPLMPSDVPRRNAELVAMFDSAASGALNHVRARRARRSAEAWLARLIGELRAQRVSLAQSTPLMRVVQHHDEDGQPLPPRIAAVEALNLLRPVVAVSVFITFVAHALQVHAAWRERLADAPTGADAWSFVQEVRRDYPFFPALVARVRNGFEWRGASVPKGMQALLDLFGTNHEARSWPEPDQFRPERWRAIDCVPRFAFVPQGGADAASHHRCPGEDFAVRLMLLSIEMLLRRMRYEVPNQQLALDMARLPALPRDGFIIANVAPVQHTPRAARVPA